MQPTHAEVARTIAAGHLPASAHIACRQGPFPVRHVTDTHGRALLLSPRDGALTGALHPIEGNDDAALVLDMVRVGDRVARLAFPAAVTDRHDLAHLLHPVLCHRCAADPA